MPREQEEFRKSVGEVLKILIFENWLRFYFLEDESGAAGEELLFIRIPEKAMAKIRNLYPEYAPLAEKLDGRPIDFESSRQAVLSHVLEYLDGLKLPRGEAQMVLNSQAFHIQNQLFSIWIQTHEAQFDQHFADFGAWLEIFAKWRQGPAAREIAENMRKGMEEK